MVLAEKALPIDIEGLYDPHDEQVRLAAIFEPRYKAVLKAVHAAVTETFGLEPDRFKLTDAATNRILVHAAERVVRIDETTRAAIAEQLRLGQELGLSSWQIANGDEKLGYRGIEGLYSETWTGRAATIARTELQDAQRISSLDRYMATGLVDRVEIFDGDQDAPCQSRNGKVVMISERPELAHPNCTLVLSPVLREGLG